MQFKILLMSALLLCSICAQGQQTWKDVWPEINEVEIKSSADGSMQKAMLYKSSKPGRPLVVHLHSWSATYRTVQPDIVPQIEYRDYNYIYPHFRGPNNRPEACGSDLVIADIEDAIAYALSVTGADRSQVHLVGSSGGGGTVMNCYMRLKYPAKSFSAWCSVTDVESWYWEVVSRGYHRYANDVLKCTSSTTTLNVAEARKRSPHFYPYPDKLRAGAALSMYAGVHDGYVADVPITQTLNMYNKIAQEKYPENKNAVVPDKDIIELLSKRSYPNAPPANIGDRKLHYHKRAGDIEVVIFEGGHDRLDDQLIGLMPIESEVKRNPITFLTLGDTAATTALGWANQLGMIFPYAKVVNRAVAGKALSDNKLGYLRTIDTTLTSVKDNPDYIVIGVGTKDAYQSESTTNKGFADNMRTMISKVKQSELYLRNKPKLIMLSCFPFDESQTHQKKYAGVTKRLSRFNRELAQIAAQENAIFIDTPALLSKSAQMQGVTLTTSDEVLLSPKAARIVVEEIARVIESKP
jgi:lysophospholipase L1-like esterase/pimeloyl-ACP methyl ester carboxylesterase